MRYVPGIGLVFCICTRGDISLGAIGNENKSNFRCSGIPHSGRVDNLRFLVADYCQRRDRSGQSCPRLKPALRSAPVELADAILYWRDVVATVLVETPAHLHG